MSKTSNTIIDVTVNKAKWELNKDSGNMELKGFTDVKPYMPLNVLDKTYFQNAVQYHLFDIGTKRFESDLLVADNEWRAAKTGSQAELDKKVRLNKAGTILDAWNKKYNEWFESLSGIYTDSTKALEKFTDDKFALMYALFISKEVSYKTEDGQDEENPYIENRWHFMNPDDETKVAGCIKDFNHDVSQANKKSAVDTLNNLANEYFRTEGGDGSPYKKIGFKVSAKQVHDNLYSASKEDIKVGKKGFKQVQKTPFILTRMFFALCLVSQGVPLTDSDNSTKKERQLVAGGATYVNMPMMKSSPVGIVNNNN